MARMPDFFEQVERDAAAVGHGITGLFHPHHAAQAAPQTPARVPATMAPTAGAAPKENRMSLATLENDVKADLTDGMNWLEGMVARVKAAAPGIIATSEALTSSTVGQVAEMFLGKVLPPDVEAELLGIVRRYVTTFGQPAQAPAAPAAPAGQ